MHLNTNFDIQDARYKRISRRAQMVITESKKKLSIQDERTKNLRNLFSCNELNK